MTVVALDTYEVVKELKAAGFEERQAEALSRLFRLSRDVDLSHLSTKGDIQEFRTETKTDLDALRISTKSDIRELELRIEAKVEASKYEIIKWMFGTIGFQTLVVVGALLALLRGILHP